MKKLLLASTLIFTATISSAATIDLSFSNGWTASFQGDTAATRLLNPTPTDIQNNLNYSYNITSGSTNISTTRISLTDYTREYRIRYTSSTRCYRSGWRRRTKCYTSYRPYAQTKSYNSRILSDIFESSGSVIDNLVATLDDENFYRYNTSLDNSWTSNNYINERGRTTLIGIEVDGESVSRTSVPEPTGIALLGLGLLGMVSITKKFKK